MKDYYTFDFYFDYLLQAVKVLHTGNNNSYELNTVYEWILVVDDETILHYKKINTVVSFDSDFDLFVDLIDYLIGIYEKIEDYERCEKLLNKKNYFKSLT
jgi:hypothetical protein